MEFKVGDKINIVNCDDIPFSVFGGITEGLEIKELDDYDDEPYSVWNREKTDYWWFKEHQVELATKKEPIKSKDFEIITTDEIIAIVDNDGDCIEITKD